MRKLLFKSSPLITLGVELEFQLIDPMTCDLISRAKDMIRNIEESPFQARITPEITQSMIEVNSSIHLSACDLYTELEEIRNFLSQQGERIGVLICGGGTHPFQKWSTRKIFPNKRFKKKYRLYRYLSKNATVFGEHIHIGCKSGEEALYLTHALARYIPQLIALSASSPFYQGIDTGFQSCRLHAFSSFPSSGYIPYLLNWKEFSRYFYKMRKLGILQTMKDVYWDVRPKPEFGTVEVRVCDTPLTIEKAVFIAAYLQVLSIYILTEKTIPVTPDLYYLYSYNRYQACRNGFDGVVVDHETLNSISIAEDILQTLIHIENYADDVGAAQKLLTIKELVIQKKNDAKQLRKMFKEFKTFPKLVREQCILWAGDNPLK